MNLVTLKIKDGKIGEAMNLLLSRYRGTKYEKELIIYSSQESINQRNNRLGIIDTAEYSRTRNRIISNLIEFTSNVEAISEENLRISKTEVQNRKILFCETNPFKDKNLLSNIELRELNRILSKSSGKMVLEARLGLGLTEFIKAIKETKPNIVHFVSYSDSGGIYFHDSGDNPEYVENNLIERFISIIAEDIDCLFFNTFVSEELAQKISINNGIIVIGFNGLISHLGAIEFGTGFYKSLKNGNTYKDSYEIGHKILEGGKNKDMIEKIYAYLEGEKIEVK